MDQLLVDRIYECAFVPEMWPEVLGELAKITGSRAGVLHIADGKAYRATASTLTASHFIAPFVELGLAWKSPLVTELEQLGQEAFARETDVAFAKGVTAEALRDAGQQDFFYRSLCAGGGGRGAGTLVELPTNDRLYFSVAREWEKGPVEDWALDQLNQLRPHLARAGYMAARLQLAQAQAASQTLAGLGLASLVMDDARKVLAANGLVERQAGVIHWDARDRFKLADLRADALLSDALETIESGDAGVRSFPVRNPEGEAALVAHVIPIRRAAQDIFSRCAAALVSTPLTAPGAPPVELIQSLFDLTPSEARVARGLASGKTVDDIATDGGVALSTVRTHVRRVLEKTGCSRQAEAVALLGGISPVRFSP